MCRGRVLTVCLCVLVAVVTGKPHECSLEQYARALLAHYNPYPAAVEPIPFDYEAVGLRPGRSNDATKLGVISPVIDPVAISAPVSPGAKVQTTPCKATLPQLTKGINDTSSMATVEKLSAYYDNLKSQQEMVARQQLQQQLFEQQQRQQQNFMVAQQQIQQQYLLQQQQALLMLEQLRKNPAFVSQLAVFAGANGTVLPNNDVTVKEQPIAVKGSSPANFKEQIIANHLEVADDCGANKRVEPRQTIIAKVDRSSATEDDGSEDDRSSSEYDDQIAYDDSEKPAVMKKVYRMVTPETNAVKTSVADMRDRAAVSSLKVTDGCGAKRLVTRQTDAVVNPLSYSGVPYISQTPSIDNVDVLPTLRKLLNGYGANQPLLTGQTSFGVDPSITSVNE